MCLALKGRSPVQLASLLAYSSGQALMQLNEHRRASAARSLTPAARHLGQSAAKRVISFFGARIRVHHNLQQTAEEEIVASLDANLGTACSAADVEREWVEKGESAADGRAQVKTALDAA